VFIEEIEIENYIGFLSGINKEKVHLDNLKDTIISITGMNGSGKTTLLNVMSIFSDSKEYLIPVAFDEKKIPIEYKPARKYLRINNEGTTYEIEHFFNKKAQKKAFITRYTPLADGTFKKEDLNPSGNMTTFSQVIEQEFGLKDNLLDNSVIGISAVNFIDLSATERKKEISILLPDVKEYIDKWKVVGEKLKILETERSVHQSEISNLPSLSQLDSLIEESKNNKISLELEINKLEAEKQDLLNSFNLKKSERKNIQDEFSEEEFDNLERKITELNNFIKTYEDIIEEATKISAEEDIKLLDENKKLLNEKVSKINQDIISINSDINIIGSKSKEKKDLSARISRSILEIERLRTEELDFSKSLKETEIKDFYTEARLEKIANTINVLQEELNNISKCNSAYNDYLFNTRNYYDKKEELNKLKNKLIELESSRKSFSSLLEKAGNLDLKTNDCDFSKCKEEFVDKIENSKKEESDLKLEINAKEKVLEEIEPIIKISERLFEEKNISKINGIIRYFNLEPLESIDNIKNALKFLIGIKNEIDEFFSNNKVNESIKISIENTKEKINKEIDRKNIEEENLKKLENDFGNFLEESKITELKEKINNLEEEKRTVLLDINTLDSKIKNLRDTIDKYYKSVEVQIAKRDINELEIKKKLFKAKNDKVKSLTEEINTLSDSGKHLVSIIENKKETLKSVETDFIKYTHNKERIETLLKMIESKAENINNHKLIREILHPTKGITNIIVNKELVQIENATNEIFKEVFDSKFQIRFMNEVDNFTIQVYEKTKDNLIPDVKYASEGQKSIIKLVLSLALIQHRAKSSTSNFVRLDECDSVLDEQNRESFEVLLNQIKDKIGIDQVFIVSHNTVISNPEQKIEFNRDLGKVEVKNRKTKE